MKPGMFLALILLYAVSGGCSTAADNTRQAGIEAIRQQFVGAWEGEHVDGEGNLVRSWIQNRSEDGTYVIVFRHYTEQGAFESKQKGKWWIEGNRFYEIAPDVMNEPDVYEFEILNENEIRFKSVTKHYDFVDKRHVPSKRPTFI